jgi:hypothetical protein
VIELMAEKAVGPKASIGNATNKEDDCDTEEEAGKKAPKRVKKTHWDVTTSQQRGNGSFKEFFREGRRNLQDAGDHALVLFVACNGLPPSVVSSKEFKNFVSTLNLDYVPASETTLSEHLIPDMAANIHQETIKYLRTCRDLTITFDGGKLRSSKGLYSVHVTTPERRAFCLTLDDAS